ncbi:Small heat shock protein IbpA [BD1-7 clade bacterium]|uniref:Small heat shock protein IbpA n=1 Tax=BD1-7 clade bacterium TaxID=2029982 RepID=A0A5S9MVZ7_9GAMM|nr:Small heat shock protein IbpA [BD1-7 clade bacterium]CAA0083551.1 Small heat shock protein IbpA [BD1-7 clade bacterium]
MNAIDLTPLYRNSIGYDRFANLLNTALTAESSGNGYPPYNIETLGENRYTITVAVAGFEESELEIFVEKGVLAVRGKKQKENGKKYLHQGIAYRSFERKFNLAEYVEVTDAGLKNGLLTVHLKKELPEAMRPRTVKINGNAANVDSLTN